MTDQEESIQHQKELLSIGRKNVRYVSRQTSTLGLSSGTNHRAALEHAYETIRTAKVYLRAMGVAVDDLPEDEPSRIEDNPIPGPFRWRVTATIPVALEGPKPYRAYFEVRELSPDLSVARGLLIDGNGRVLQRGVQFYTARLLWLDVGVFVASIYDFTTP